MADKAQTFRDDQRYTLKVTLKLDGERQNTVIRTDVRRDQLPFHAEDAATVLSYWAKDIRADD